jgi:hypothetical protein
MSNVNQNNGTQNNKNNVLFNELVNLSLELKNRFLILHWNTKLYPIHKNTDMTYNDLHSVLDNLVETYLGTLREDDIFLLTKLNSYETNTGNNHTRLIKIIDNVMAKISEFKNAGNLHDSVKNILDEYSAVLLQFKYLSKIK